ncbi:MAG: hypothetical protein JNK05_23720 [Myxococcales bacterium]|nr:hypothetical protein [Myxococcales bacterium]
MVGVRRALLCVVVAAQVTLGCREPTTAARVTREVRDVIDVQPVISVADASMADAAAATESHVRAGDRVATGWIAEAEREPVPEALRRADALDRRECAPLPSPKLPIVAPELAADVLRYRAIARRTIACHNGVFRFPHRPSRRCDAWFGELARGGPAAMHALGIELTQMKARADEDALPCGSNFIGTAAHRAALVLAGYGDAQAMPYLLRYLAIQTPRALFAGYDGYAVQLAFDGVRRLARRDIGPVWIDPLEDPSAHWTEVVRRWGHWYLAHRAEPVSRWQSEGIATTRALLDAPSVAVRYAAYETLSDLESERAALRAVRADACAADARGVEDREDEPGDEVAMNRYLCGATGSPTSSFDP